MTAVAKQAVSDNEYSVPTDLCVSGDGTSMKRGHQSLHGVSTVVSVDTGEVLDIEVEKDEKGDDGNNKEDWQERLRLLSKHRVIVGGVLIFIILLIIIIVIAASGPSPPSHMGSPGSGRYVDAITSCGPVQGLVEDGAFVFRGIPYAAPPVDERRWLKAQLIQNLNDCWEGTFLAYNTTPSCWQLHSDGSMDGSEDCLTLDVYTPRIGYHSPLPVVVLIGAETLLGGSPGDLVPSGKLAKEHEVVFVRLNFRMGVFGFLASDVLSQSTHPPTSGNYGLSDILAALKWVNLNIVNFNGDQKSVTVLGHRAGATLVTALTTSRLSHGLFHRAWLSSGSGVYPGKQLQESEMKNAKYVKNIEQCQGNITADCLRLVDPEDLIKGIPDSWKPVISDLPKPEEEPAHEWLVLDGEILQRHPFEVFSNGSLPFKIIIGTTAHAEASPELYRRYEDLMAVGEEAVANHIRSSVLGKNLTIAEEAIRRYGTTWPGLASMIKYPNCDLWFMYDIVSRYARVD
ncbi:neurotactin-like [Anabrus simplex]|uniref:neurotactin-like n=1 Tax=Anabrus simplex TaxID=316456 RepID=UPI0035A332B8